MLTLKGKHDYKNHPLQFFLIKKEGDNSIFNTNQQMYVFHALIPRLHFFNLRVNKGIQYQ